MDFNDFKDFNDFEELKDYSEFQCVLDSCVEEMKQQDITSNFEDLLVKEIKNYDFYDIDEVVGIFHNNTVYGDREVLSYYDMLRETEAGKEYSFMHYAECAIRDYLENCIICRDIGGTLKNYYNI